MSCCCCFFNHIQNRINQFPVYLPQGDQPERVVERVAERNDLDRAMRAALQARVRQEMAKRGDKRWATHQRGYCLCRHGDGRESVKEARITSVCPRTSPISTHMMTAVYLGPEEGLEPKAQRMFQDVGGVNQQSWALCANCSQEGDTQEVDTQEVDTQLYITIVCRECR